MATSKLTHLARQFLPQSLRDGIIATQRKYRLQRIRKGSVNFGDFSRTSPISSRFGYDRGMAIDRYYIEQFLDKHRNDIYGRCLEMGDSFYIKKFGTGVTQIDVMHYVEGNPEATIVGDLTDAQHIPSNTFQCIIFTQSLQMIYDLKAALHTLHRILAPGGVLLLTSAGISKIARHLGEDDWGEYWHLTTQSAEALFSETFPHANTDVKSYGNVLSAVSFLHGLAAEELSSQDLQINDPNFEVLVTARVAKAITSNSPQAGT